MEVAANAMDWAKLIHIGLTADLPKGWLERKLQLYRERGIKTYPGGIPYQVALVQNKTKEFFDWLVKMGFDAVEIAEDAMRFCMLNGAESVCPVSLILITLIKNGYNPN